MSGPPANPWDAIARMEREERARRRSKKKTTRKKAAKKKTAKKKTKKKTKKKVTRKKVTRKKVAKKRRTKKVAKKKAAKKTARKKVAKKKTSKKKVSKKRVAKKARRKKTSSRAGTRFQMGLERKRIKVIDAQARRLVSHEVEVITPDRLLGYMRKGRKTFLVHVPSGGALGSSPSRAKVERAAHRALQSDSVKAFLKNRATKNAIRGAGLRGTPIPSSVGRSSSEFVQILAEEGIS